MATNIRLGKNKYLRLNRKDWFVILFVLIAIGAGITFHLINKGEQNSSNVPEASQDKYSLTNGYFYKSIRSWYSSSRDVSFNYPNEWGDVKFSNAYLDGKILKDKNDKEIVASGTFVLATFTNNSNIYFVGRSPGFNVTPELYENNIQLFSEIGLNKSELSLIYNQVGGWGCKGDSKYFQEDIDINNAQQLNCPTGAETVAGESPTIKTSDTKKVGYTRLLPPFNHTSSNKYEHVAILDFPLGIFGNELTELYAIALVNLNNEKLPDNEFINVINSIKLE